MTDSFDWASPGLENDRMRKLNGQVVSWKKTAPFWPSTNPMYRVARAEDLHDRGHSKGAPRQSSLRKVVPSSSSSSGSSSHID